MLHEASPSGIANTVPERRGGKPGATGDPPPNPGPEKPVPFDRLLSVAVLTPAQATLVAVRLLDAAHLAGTVDGEHLRGAGLGAVSFTASGDVAVAPPGTGAGTGVTELLERLLQNAHRLPTHPRKAQLLLLHRLEEATRDHQREPVARARELEATLADTLGPGVRQRLAGELAALVEAFTQITPGFPDPTDPPAAPHRVLPPPPAAPPPDLRRAPNRPAGRSKALTHPRKRGRRVALLVFVVAVALAASGYVMAGGPGSGIVESLGRDGNPAGPATPASDHHPSKGPAAQHRQTRAEAVATLAPRHSGPVTGVVVQKAGSCSPGALCPVTVTVHFRPSSTPRPISWKVGAARMCRRGIAWSAPTAVTALAGWTRVYASSSVRVPRGRALALVALTTTPARAQSRPVPVAGSLHC